MTDTNTSIKQDIQDLNVGSPLVSLYSLDLTSLGGSTYYLTAGPLDNDIITFNGIDYAPLPIQVEGMEWSGDGKMPRPTITISNITLAFLAEVVSLGDMVGAVFTRIRTYKKYLDGEAEADPTAQFPADIFEINRKLKHNKYLMQFELKSPLDLERVLIPKRQVLPFCQHTYRVYNTTTETFDYSNASCPYTDTDYYDASGSTVTAANDVCGKRLFDCRLRFPSTNNTDNQLPARMFPGVGRFGKPYRK